MWQIRLHKGEIIVAAIPDHNIGFRLRHPENLGIVHAGKDDVPHHDMRLVLLALFRGALRAIEIGDGREPLGALLRQVPVGHRMPHHGNPQSPLSQPMRKPAGNRRLAAARPHRGDRNHRQRRMQHGPLGAKQSEVGSGGQCPRRHMHHMLMGDVAISEHHFIDGMSAAQSLELRLFADRNASRVKPPGQRRWVAATIDIGNLSCREGDDFNRRIVAVDHIEIVEVPSGGSHNDDASAPKTALLAGPQQRFICKKLRAGRFH